jgi:hypothetical protein
MGRYVHIWLLAQGVVEMWKPYYFISIGLATAITPRQTGASGTGLSAAWSGINFPVEGCCCSAGKGIGEGCAMGGTDYGLGNY